MNYAVILAGGTGSRAGGPLPKQFQYIGGRRMLWWSVDAFRKFDPECRIILAVHPDYLKRWKEIFGNEEKELGIEGVMKVPGGESRIESVKNALRTIDEEGTVFIHDAARPFVSPELIGRGASAIASGCGAVPVVPLADSIRHLTADGSESVPRSEYVAVQTPQVFCSEDIKAAYFNLENEEGLTDDASVAELYGIRINMFDGEPSNIKITTPADIDRFTDHH